LRYFNAAGASADGLIGEDWTSSANLVPVVMKALLGAGPPVQVFGCDYPTPDGTCIRDYIHVEDLADAHVRALDYLDADGTTAAVNVGTGVGTSVFELLAAAERVTGRQVPREHAARRAGDPVATYADPTSGRQLLDWTAQHDLGEIIETAYRWHAGTMG
jgi:UDP-glucose 4-epimerase